MWIDAEGDGREAKEKNGVRSDVEQKGVSDGVTGQNGRKKNVLRRPQVTWHKGRKMIMIK